MGLGADLTVKPRGVILDLDQTLIDSSVASELRRRRSWPEVYASISGFTLYDGIIAMLGALRDQNIAVAIVTSSPNSYASRVLKHFQIGVDQLICYHDTRRHKPDPAPIQLAVDRLRLCPSEIWSIGDEAKDIAASRSAGTLAGGALWGALDPHALRQAGPDFIDDNPFDLIERIAASA